MKEYGDWVVQLKVVAFSFMVYFLPTLIIMLIGVRVIGLENTLLLTLLAISAVVLVQTYLYIMRVVINKMVEAKLQPEASTSSEVIDHHTPQKSKKVKRRTEQLLNTQIASERAVREYPLKFLQEEFKDGELDLKPPVDKDRKGW